MQQQFLHVQCNVKRSDEQGTRPGPCSTTRSLTSGSGQHYLRHHPVDFSHCDVNTSLPNLITWFLPRDAMHKRGLCRRAVFVRPSVRLSVTFVDHVKRNKHIFEIFLPSGSHTILVFRHQTGWRYSDRNPLTGASNAGGV